MYVCRVRCVCQGRADGACGANGACGAHLASAKWCAWYHGLDDAALERLKAAILSVDIGTKVAKNDEASNREDSAVVFAFQFIRTCAPCVMSCVVR